MKATWTLLAGLLLAATAGTASAQYPAPPCYPGPQACGPYGAGFYSAGAYGMGYGMNYSPQPAYPFTMLGPGVPPLPPMGGRQIGFPTHPYARSPRDFFMLGN